MKTPHVSIIVQARMGSSRLPGKVLKEVLNRPLLSFQIERLRRIKNSNSLVIATSDLETDDPIEEFCSRENIICFRGSETNVLSRYFGAAREQGADVVVRSTADCPLIDPKICEETIQRFLDAPESFDYVSNAVDGKRTYPRGLDIEVFSFSTLEKAFHESTTDFEREHVTGFIVEQPKRFRIQAVTHPIDLSTHRWTVDTPEDFELIRRILENLYPKKPNFLMQDILDLLAKHPDWSELNRHIEQKKR